MWSGGVQRTTFTYDANGNLVSGDGRTITFDKLDRPIVVVMGGVTTLFQYAPDGSRYLQRTVGSDISFNRTVYYTAVQDMRKSFDTLAAVARDFMGEEPEKGAVFVFLGKSSTRLKLLWFDRNGYCLLAKRLHRAFFLMPKFTEAKGTTVRIDSDALAQLLAGVTRESRRVRRVH